MRQPETVAVFPDRPSAELARARLEAAGVTAAVHGDDAGGLYPNLSSAGVRLMVAGGDLIRAQEVLEES